MDTRNFWHEISGTRYAVGAPWLPELTWEFLGRDWSVFTVPFDLNIPKVWLSGNQTLRHSDETFPLAWSSQYRGLNANYLDIGTRFGPGPVLVNPMDDTIPQNPSGWNSAGAIPDKTIELYVKYPDRWEGDATFSQSQQLRLVIPVDIWAYTDQSEDILTGKAWYPSYHSGLAYGSSAYAVTDQASNYAFVRFETGGETSGWLVCKENSGAGNTTRVRLSKLYAPGNFPSGLTLERIIVGYGVKDTTLWNYPGFTTGKAYRFRRPFAWQAIAAQHAAGGGCDAYFEIVSTDATTSVSTGLPPGGEGTNTSDNSNGGSTSVTNIVTGGGVTDHAALTNLDYSSAGHTGFVPDLRLLNTASGLFGGADFVDDLTIGIDYEADHNFHAVLSGTSGLFDQASIRGQDTDVRYALSGALRGLGTSGTLPIFDASKNLTNSIVSQVDLGGVYALSITDPYTGGAALLVPDYYALGFNRIYAMPPVNTGFGAFLVGSQVSGVVGSVPYYSEAALISNSDFRFIATDQLSGNAYLGVSGTFSKLSVRGQDTDARYQASGLYYTQAASDARFQASGFHDAFVALSDVSISGQVTGDIVKWNGSKWITAANTQTVGSANTFYLDATVAVADNLKLSTAPSTYPETIKTVAVQASTSPVFLERFTSDALGRSTLSAGAWSFQTFGASSAATGNTQIHTRINRRVLTPNCSGTFTGAGATRTFTTTSGVFVPADANASVLLATLIETPTQTAWINAYTSSSGVTVTLTDPGFVNVANVALTACYYLLFSGVSADINSATPLNLDYTVIASGYAVNDTDRIVAAYFAKTDHASSRNVSLYYGGSQNYSHIDSPLSTLHNDLAGLNLGDYRHLTAAEYATFGTLAAGATPGLSGLADVSGIWTSGKFVGFDGSKFVPSTATGGGGAVVLDDLTDVTITSVTSGQVLSHNGSAWINAASAGGSSTVDYTADQHVISNQFFS